MNTSASVAITLISNNLCFKIEQLDNKIRKNIHTESNIAVTSDLMIEGITKSNTVANIEKKTKPRKTNIACLFCSPSEFLN